MSKTFSIDDYMLSKFNCRKQEKEITFLKDLMNRFSTEIMRKTLINLSEMNLIVSCLLFKIFLINNRKNKYFV